LPLADRFDVHLLGTGLPSFWVAHMGEMQLTLGLSGWTTNDWTRGSALDLLAPPATISEDLVLTVGALLQQRRSMTLSQLGAATGGSTPALLAALRRLAFTGQAIHDLPNCVYRFRQATPMVLDDAMLGPENAELTGARQLLLTRKCTLDSAVKFERGVLLTGRVEAVPVEVMVDLDGRIRRGKCLCGYFRKYGIRNGPCRHMIALRTLSTDVARTDGFGSQN
jgi:hypothetical protein